MIQADICSMEAINSDIAVSQRFSVLSEIILYGFSILMYQNKFFRNKVFRFYFVKAEWPEILFSLTSLDNIYISRDN